MASSSATSQTQVVSSSGGSGEEPQVGVVVDMRKRKRMLSNRESARRSRLRKQTHLDDLTAQVSQLRTQNGQIAATVGLTTQQYLRVEAENSVLRAQMDELSNRLQSLNDIINCLNNVSSHTTTNNMLNLNPSSAADTAATDEFDLERFGGCFDDVLDFDDGFSMNPWGLSFGNHPVMPALDAFMC